MYEMIKSIIISGDFKVTDITNKIDVLWVSGDLTDEQRTELHQMITSHLNPGTEAPEEAELYKRLEGRQSGKTRRRGEKAKRRTGTRAG